MKFKVGDKIKIVRIGNSHYFGWHIGSVGIVTELRRYSRGRREDEGNPTHYVVKFDCYKIPHIYMQCEIETSCELLNEE